MIIFLIKKSPLRLFFDSTQGDMLGNIMLMLWLFKMTDLKYFWKINLSFMIKGCCDMSKS